MKNILDSDYFWGIIAFIVFCAGLGIGGLFGYYIESQIWLAHCAQVYGTIICSHP